MKLFTPDKTELLVVSALSPHADGLLIEGKIMGAMPMKAVLRPAELRSSLGLLSLRTVFALIVMLFKR
ncbi:MAG: hypothetical protein EXR28_16495 [Betaproteobacteria bacterium]|nr:hypothetical protein [Betaproteobacteria bacterium]